MWWRLAGAERRGVAQLGGRWGGLGLSGLFEGAAALQSGRGRDWSHAARVQEASVLQLLLLLHQ